ncbi:MAG: hypothetical protein L7F77_12730, partial [Candidatus Magnetominusculus sp. LBB02]|nr:hypothetical protein [Candidatus Magnetominusculus sp. LBB02]
KQAIALDPNSANNLGNYAVFLKDIRKDYDEAAHCYKQAIALDLNSANNLGNYAGFLLSLGKSDDGFTHLQRAIDLVGDNTALLLECLFYRYAHLKGGGGVDIQYARMDDLVKIKRLIKDGVRSPGWNLQGNVDRAVADGFPEPELLATLAKVIVDEAQAEALDKFPAWTSIK